MKQLFKKALTVLGSVALVGSSIGAAMAANYPSPFTSNTAVVYGAGSAPEDFKAATDIVANLNAAATGSVSLVGGEGATETEVPLGSGIDVGSLASATTGLTDSKIPSLLDEQLSWDDGGASGTDDYRVHEAIVITNASMKLQTRLDDNEYTENVALTNDKAIEYRYIFDSAFNTTGVNTTAGSDDLYLSLLGKNYEVTDMTTTTFTVTTSTEYTLKLGESAVVDGKTFTVEDLSSTSAKVNGETLTTSAKKINGLRVKVKSGSIFYNENFPETASVTLQIGADISKTYSDGEAYVGEDEDDPQWIWTYSDPDTANGYIGVKYNYKETRDTDDVVYKGGSYVFPENFAAVSFDGLTNVDYEDFKFYFDSSEDLWNNSDLTSTAQVQDAPVFIIEAVNGDTDAILLSDSNETSKIYFRFANSTQEIQGTQTNSSLEVYFSDVSGTIQDSVKPRFSAAYATNHDYAGGNATTLAASDIGDLVVGDTTIAISAVITNGNLVLNLTDSGVGHQIGLDLGGVNLTNTTGQLKWFGGDAEATDKEDGLASDLSLGTTLIGTYDNDVMTYDGIIIKTPEANLDNDEVILSVPSDRVYGVVSVKAGGEASGEAGALTVLDTDTAGLSGKNLIVVGGSAINSVAAELLGSAYRGDAFTAQTTVSAGEFLIQSFNRNGKTALLVAGYEAADTTKAATYLTNKEVDTTVGKKYVGTSATEATLVVN